MTQRDDVNSSQGSYNWEYSNIIFTREHSNWLHSIKVTQAWQMISVRYDHSTHGFDSIQSDSLCVDKSLGTKDVKSNMVSAYIRKLSMVPSNSSDTRTLLLYTWRIYLTAKSFPNLVRVGLVHITWPISTAFFDDPVWVLRINRHTSPYTRTMGIHAFYSLSIFYVLTHVIKPITLNKSAAIPCTVNTYFTSNWIVCYCKKTA